MTCPSCEASTDSSQRRCASCGEALPVSAGWVIAERYEIQAALGEGGMGAVFRARDRALHVNVAFKVLRLAHDATAVRRFHHEVALARKVKHENVCAVYEYGEDQGILYCTMELVGGRTLRQVIREQAPLPVDRAYRVALNAAAGLRAIHEAGVLHRDLKTSNIMVDDQERVRLVDFGIARAMPTPEQEEPTTDTSITGNEGVVGTPAYMSPEQVMGWPLDARSDIYSFGIVLFELFTGELPFPASSRAAILRKQLEEPPPLHGRLAQSLPNGLVPLLERALAKDPDRRYPDVPALIQDLERTRDSFQTRTMDAVASSVPRRWLLSALALVAGVALIALIATHPPNGPQPTPNPTPPPTTPSAPSPSFHPPSPSLPPISTTTPRGSSHGGTVAPPTSRPTSTTTTSNITTTTTVTTTTTTVPPSPEAPIQARTNIPPVIVEPRCVSCPPPVYPSVATQFGLEGRVEIEITVDVKGNVTATRVRSGHSALRGAAQKAVRNWRFAPATRDGVPIEYVLTKIVVFQQKRP